MTYNRYIDCIEANLLPTGGLQVYYDFASGVQDVINIPGEVGGHYYSSDFLYNLRYGTGDHVKETTVPGFGSAKVIRGDFYPGFSMGQTDMPVTSLGYFSGVDYVRVGFNVNYSGWTAALDISPNLCDYADQNNLSRILFSTMESYDSASGFYVGINQANKLYIRYNYENSHESATLNREIGKNSVVSISQSDSDITIGVYDLEKEESELQGIDTENYIPTKQIYLGGFPDSASPTQLPPPNPEYTGYEGLINNFALYDEPFADTRSTVMCRCMFSSGIETTSTTSTIVAPNITGFEEVISYTTGITGYVEAYKDFQDSDGTHLLVAFQSGIMGAIETGSDINLLTGELTSVSETTVLSGSLDDEDKINFYNRYFLNFKGGLVSGEHVEVLTFKEPRDDIAIGLDPDYKVTGSGIRLYNYGLYRQSVNDPTYITQGSWGELGARIASEENGHEYDYTVLEDNTVTGLMTSEQSIVYDLVDRAAICIDFSGWFGNATYQVLTTPREAFAMVCSDPQYTTEIFCEADGSCSDTQYTTKAACEAASETWTSTNTWGPVGIGYYPGYMPNRVPTGSNLYFPPGPQFFNETNSNSQPFRDQGQVIITGISGQKIWENNHIYYNGQKLIENVDFFTGHIETGNSLSTDALVITGNMGGVFVHGGGPNNLQTSESIINTPNSFYTPEMCFVPKVSGEQPGEFLESITGNVDGIEQNLSGFSEMVWRNGIRQTEYLDYKIGKECSLKRSFTFFGENPFIFYNNDEEFLNFG